MQRVFQWKREQIQLNNSVLSDTSLQNLITKLFLSHVTQLRATPDKINTTPADCAAYGINHSPRSCRCLWSGRALITISLSVRLWRRHSPFQASRVNGSRPATLQGSKNVAKTSTLVGLRQVQCSYSRIARIHTFHKKKTRIVNYLRVSWLLRMEQREEKKFVIKKV